MGFLGFYGEIKEGVDSSVPSILHLSKLEFVNMLCNLYTGLISQLNLVYGSRNKLCHVAAGVKSHCSPPTEPS